VGEFGQHSTFGSEIPKREVREARPDQVAGRASGGSSLLLPWLGSIRERGNPGRMNGHLGQSPSLVILKSIAWEDPISKYLSLVTCKSCCCCCCYHPQPLPQLLRPELYHTRALLRPLPRQPALLLRPRLRHMVLALN